MSEPKPLKVLTSADDVLDVMMEHYVDGDFGYFREGDASEAIWIRIEATIAADRRAHANLKRQVGVAVAHPYEESDNRLIGIVKAFIGADRRRIDRAEEIIGSLIKELRERAHVVIYSDAKLEAYRRDYPEGKK